MAVEIDRHTGVPYFKSDRGDDRKDLTEPCDEYRRIYQRVWQAALFTEIWDAMKVTFKHMFHRPITFQYPREQRVIPDAHRGALGLLRYDDGHERCA